MNFCYIFLSILLATPTVFNRHVAAPAEYTKQCRHFHSCRFGELMIITQNLIRSEIPFQAEPLKLTIET